ncbi:MAG: GNVR domain-containing protein [bacterium]
MQRFQQYLRILLKWRRLLFVNSLVLTVIAVAVSLVLPHRYAAVGRLLPPADEDAFGLSSMLGGTLGGSRLNRLMAGAILGGATPSDLMLGVLTSRSVMQEVVERGALMDHYRIRDRSMEKAVRRLAKMTDTEISDDGIVVIAVEAKTPDLAAELVNLYIDELDRFMRTSNIGRGRNMRLFIEQRLSEVERVLAGAQDSLEVFQQRNRVASIDDEAEAAIGVYAQLRSRLYVREAELAMMEGISSPDNPLTARLQAEVEAFRRQLVRLESGGRSVGASRELAGGFGVGFSLPFDSLAAVSAEYLRRYRDFKVQEEAYLLLWQQLEYAKILEARDTPSLSVLDYAIPPERRSFPRRWVIVFGTLVFSLVAGAAFAFVAEYFDRIKVASSDEYRGWLELRQQAREATTGLRRFLSPRKRRDR